MGHVIYIDGLEQRIRPHSRDRGADPRHTGETVKEVILGAEHDRGAQDNSLRHMLEHTGLPHRLGLGIFAIRLGIRPDGRDLHQTRDPFGGGQARNAFCAVGLNGVKGVLPRLGQNTDAVHHRISALQRIAYRRVITDVAKDRFDLADSPVGAHKQRLVRATHRDAHPPPRQRHATNDIPPHKPGAAVNRDQLCHDDTPDQKI